MKTNQPNQSELEHLRTILKSKTGFVFTLDLIIGLGIIFSLVLVSLFFISKGTEAEFSEQQLLRVGSDVAMVLDQQKVFDSLDYRIIEQGFHDILPPNYDGLLLVQGNFTVGNGTIEVGGEIPQGIPIIVGQRAALTDDNTYLRITYSIWTREQSVQPGNSS